jgi:hypothetical protein
MKLCCMHSIVATQLTSGWRVCASLAARNGNMAGLLDCLPVAAWAWERGPAVGRAFPRLQFSFQLTIFRLPSPSCLPFPTYHLYEPPCLVVLSVPHFLFIFHELHYEAGQQTGWVTMLYVCLSDASFWTAQLIVTQAEWMDIQTFAGHASTVLLTVCV